MSVENSSLNVVLIYMHLQYPSVNERVSVVESYCCTDVRALSTVVMVYLPLSGIQMDVLLIIAVVWCAYLFQVIKRTPVFDHCCCFILFYSVPCPHIRVRAPLVDPFCCTDHLPCLLAIKRAPVVDSSIALMYFVDK